MKLRVKGRGMSASVPIGEIPENKKMTAKVRIKPKKPGKVIATFKVTSKNAGTESIKRTIEVKPR